MEVTHAAPICVIFPIKSSGITRVPRYDIAVHIRVLREIDRDQAAHCHSNGFRIR